MPVKMPWKWHIVGVIAALGAVATPYAHFWKETTDTESVPTDPDSELGSHLYDAESEVTCPTRHG